MLGNLVILIDVSVSFVSTQFIQTQHLYQRKRTRTAPSLLHAGHPQPRLSLHAAIIWLRHPRARHTSRQHGTTMMPDESWNRRRPAGARLTASSAPCQEQCTPAHHRLLLDVTPSPERGRESPDDSRGLPPPSFVPPRRECKHQETPRVTTLDLQDPVPTRPGPRYLTCPTISCRATPGAEAKSPFERGNSSQCRPGRGDNLPAARDWLRIGPYLPWTPDSVPDFWKTGSRTGGGNVPKTSHPILTCHRRCHT